MEKEQTIVGLSGPFSGGKDASAEQIETGYGFANISTSDVLRAMIREVGEEPNRENMNRYGRIFRERYGPSFLVDRALEMAGDKDKVLVTGLRSPAEADAIHERGGKLIEVTADAKTRWDRLVARGRAGDFTNFDEFIAMEQREAHSDDPNKPATAEVTKKADYVVQNDQSFEVLKQRISDIIDEILDSNKHGKPRN